jgi:outer membrane beta-barrel protein
VKQGLLKNFINAMATIAVALSSDYALAQNQDIPFDGNLQQGSTAEDFVPNPDELKTPPELDIPLAPVPNPATTTGVNKKQQSPAELSGLGKLSPFDDIAVISKRYLPKTKRLEFFPNFGLVLNDSFFSDVVLGGRLSYYFSEQYGLEANALSVNSSNKQVTNELLTRGIGTQSLASPTSFYGLDFKWVPVYGKFGWMNKSIIPFDLYFVAGGGVTGTNQSTNPPTFHFGGGQIFAIQKWLAFRWDVSWYAYQTTTTVSKTAANLGTSSTSLYNNIHGTIGLSFFFPGAGYR